MNGHKYVRAAKVDVCEHLGSADSSCISCCRSTCEKTCHCVFHGHRRKLGYVAAVWFQLRGSMLLYLVATSFLLTSCHRFSTRLVLKW